MKSSKDNPGVVIPPPLIYAAVFLLSVLMQKVFPLNDHLLHGKYSHYLFFLLLAMAICFTLPALLQFLRSNNTLITIKPANSLQTKGVYAICRNPMYTGLLLLYIALAFKLGNDWTLLFIPIVVFIITRYVIRKEENYLERTFTEEFLRYKSKVKRWI
jgi:protein-S-isoprenylcysteine O-methyltransferase Ste14